MRVDYQQSARVGFDRHHLEQFASSIRAEKNETRIRQRRAPRSGLAEDDAGSFDDVTTAIAADPMTGRRPSVLDLHDSIVSDRLDDSFPWPLFEVYACEPTSGGRMNPGSVERRLRCSRA